MFGMKLNVQKELDKLAEEEQALRNKYGSKFSTLYHRVVDSIANNARIIDTARNSNKVLDGELTEVITAMETINYEMN